MNEKKNRLNDEALEAVTSGTATNGTGNWLEPDFLCPKCGSIRTEQQKNDDGSVVWQCLDCKHTW